MAFKKINGIKLIIEQDKRQGNVEGCFKIYVDETKKSLVSPSSYISLWKPYRSFHRSFSKEIQEFLEDCRRFYMHLKISRTFLKDISVRKSILYIALDLRRLDSDVFNTIVLIWKHFFSLDTLIRTIYF